MNVLGAIKFFVSFVSFSLLGGSSLGIYSGLLVEIFYPQIFSEFWGVWWILWVAFASLLYFIRNKATCHLLKSILVAICARRTVGEKTKVLNPV